MLASPPTLMVVVGTTKKRETVVVLVAVVVEQQQKFEYSMQHSDYSDMPHSSKTHIVRKKPEAFSLV